MPTYDYFCTNCSYEFEEFQKINDPVLEKCPRCSGKVQRKIGGGAGLLFKGSGFYITDYKKDGKGKNENPEKSKTKESSKKEDKK